MQSTGEELETCRAQKKNWKHVEHAEEELEIMQCSEEELERMQSLKEEHEKRQKSKQKKNNKKKRRTYQQNQYVEELMKFVEQKGCRAQKKNFKKTKK